MSYGTNAPQGFQPSVTYTGATWSGQQSNYLITSGYSTSIFTGDPVAPLADGTIGIGVAGSAVLGVFQGCTYPDSNGIYQFFPYWLANAVVFGTPAGPANAFVLDDPAIEFNIQTSTSLVLVDVWQNANFAIAAGSTRTGQSGTYLDMATKNTTATLNCKIIGLTPVVGNTFGLAFNNALVTLNNHVLKGGTGTSGV